MTVAALVLAAGRSIRAGATNKLTAPVGGAPLVAHAVDAALASPARPVIVVTGHQADAVRKALSGRDVRFAHNPDYADGMSTSIRAGIKALPADADAVVICLGDMPALAGGDIAKLIAAFAEGGAAICIPVAGARRGNPVLFARKFFADLAALTGDAGARAIIKEHPEMVREVAVDGAGVLTDLDTEAEIAAYNREQNQ